MAGRRFFEPQMAGASKNRWVLQTFPKDALTWLNVVGLSSRQPLTKKTRVESALSTSLSTLSIVAVFCNGRSCIIYAPHLRSPTDIGGPSTGTTEQTRSPSARYSWRSPKAYLNIIKLTFNLPETDAALNTRHRHQ